MEYLRFVSIVTASSVQAVHLDRVFVLVMKKNAWANLETIWSSYNQSKARYQDYLLLPKKLTHPSFPSTTLVQSHTPVLWAPPRKPSALTPEYVNKLLLGPILHLTGHKLISQDRSIPHSKLKHPSITSVVQAAYLLQVSLIVLQMEVDVCVEAPELDRSPVIGPAQSKSIQQSQDTHNSSQIWTRQC